MPKSIEMHPAHSKRTVLVVDDELVNREMLRFILQEHYHVLDAADGDEAMELLCTQCDTISLVLLDLMMPRVNGLDVLRTMHRDPDLEHIPVIVMTSDQSAEVESLKLGAFDFIPKPYSHPEVILARVERIIELCEDQQIIQSTERDRLTGLYNRDYFFRYAHLFDQRRPDVEMDAIVLDINHFRLINERYGKSYGDMVLRTISQRLTAALERSGGISCRRGADTFLIYCPHGQDYQTLLDGVSGAETDEGHRVRLRMGVYPTVDKTIDMDRRFDRAKVAADKVRDNYAQSISFYDSALHDAELYAEQLLEDFPAAIQGRQFVVYYQPKFDIRGDNPILASAEALIRWEHPRLGFISPGAFIPLFEEKGLIAQLDRYVWREVAAQIQSWKKELGMSVPVSVNISRMDMYDPGLVEHFQTLMETYHLSPTEYLLEITESAYTQDSGQIIAAVNRLRELGFLVEMDDFGTGYSSLNMLSTLPIDALKLDMQFIRSAFKEGGDLRLLELVIDIARYLQVPTIAEGVETAQQLDALKTLGCDYVQGFYFSRPVPPEDFVPFLLQRKRQSSIENRINPHVEDAPVSASADIASALSEGFESVYYVDAASGHYVEFNSSGKYQSLQIERSGKDFFGDTQRNLRRVVMPEDQTLVSAALERDVLLEALSKQETFSIAYRLLIDDAPVRYILRASKAAGKGPEHLLIGVKNAEPHQAEPAASRTEAFNSIAQSLSSDFVCIYYVNLNDESYVDFSIPGVYQTLPVIFTGQHFFDECRSNLQAVVFYEDQPRVEAMLNRERLLERLAQNPVVVMDYRLVFGGEPVYYRMKITRDEAHPDHLVIGVSDISIQRQQEQEYDAARNNSVTYSLIAQALSQDYFCIYYINLNTKGYIEFSNQGPSHRLIPQRTGDDFFAVSAAFIRKHVLPQDQELVLSVTNLEQMLSLTKDGAVHSIVFQSYLDGQPVHMNMKSLRLPGDDSHLVMGLRNIEEQVQWQQEYESTKAERTTYSRIARALAQDYFSIYYVDVDSEEYVKYSPTGRFQELREEYHSTDFFQRMKEFIPLNIYAEDQAKAAQAWQKETILHALASSPSFSASYRMLVDHEPVHVNCKVIKMQDVDDHHIIIGINNIEDQIRRDQAFAEARQMAFRDDLTGVKNKRAYSKREEELNLAIADGSANRFAVLVCDINDLKLANDTAGHRAGDAYIRQVTEIICSVFSHSPVFRIGGDEFVALLFDRDYRNRRSLMRLLRARSRRTRSRSGLPVLSCGIAEFRPGVDTSLSDVFQRADSAMYQQKSQLKAHR